MINSLLIVASVLIFMVVVALLYIKAKNKVVKVAVENYNTMEKVLELVKNEMVELLRDNSGLTLSDEEFNKLYKRKARINDALKNSVYGIESAKILVIDLIRGIIAEKVKPEYVTSMLGLDEYSTPSSHVKFEILMYKYKKYYGKKALAKWIAKNGFDKERLATNASREQDKSYYVTEEDLEKSYNDENINLNIEEQLDVISTLVYQQYKGFGILDTLREMDINGFNCGTSGSILKATNQVNSGTFKATKSVWVYFQGKYIHMRFMNFGSEEELKRIIMLLIRYGNPGPLTAKRGYLVNTMCDKSRILALRPPASEYWAVFVRKFTLSDVSPEALIVKPYTVQGDLVIQLLEFLIRGQITCGVTGRQGSGKTTLMSSLIRYIDPRHTIRVLEMAPELYLRDLYPTRNILSVQETSNVSAEELQDALKKSDAAVSIVGEVATDAIAGRMIQMGQVASLFTIFSHHANTARDLIFALRNSLSNAGNFTNMQTAEKQVTDVVKIDIHLDYTPEGKRYIDRVTEIVQLEEGVPYPEYEENEPIHSMNKITKEYYERSTDRVSFYTHDILRYDLNTDTYYAVDRLSEQLEEKIRRNLGKELCYRYDYFMLKYWGKRENDTSDIDSELKELEAKIREQMAYSENISDELGSSEYTDNNYMTPEDKAIWAKGYEPDGEESETQDSSIGLFFDDN